MAFIDASAERPLPPSWVRVPSRSRPGEFSYQHLITGLKQTKFPESEPSAAEVAEQGRSQEENEQRLLKKAKQSRDGDDDDDDDNDGADASALDQATKAKMLKLKAKHKRARKVLRMLAGAVADTDAACDE